MLRRGAFDVNFAIVGSEYQEKSDYELPFQTMYYDATYYQKHAAKILKEVRDDSKELVKAKDYSVEGGKNDVCKAIRDLMDDSREEGREEGREETLTIAIKKKLEKNKSIEQMADELEITFVEAEFYVSKLREEL